MSKSNTAAIFLAAFVVFFIGVWVLWYAWNIVIVKIFPSLPNLSLMEVFLLWVFVRMFFTFASVTKKGE